MTKLIQCPCGFLIREAIEESLIRSAQAHAKAVHGIELTREHALAMAKPERSNRRVTNGKGT
jgi:predicted small metal-binding protein